MGQIFSSKIADCLELHGKLLFGTITDNLQNFLCPLVEIQLRRVG